MKKLQFSPKQRQVLDWWKEDRFDAVICDGAVRSGKTFTLSVSFFLWAMAGFHRQRFGLCAASINGWAHPEYPEWGPGVCPGPQ